MRKLDAETAELEVFTFKEGALSGLAHDLRLRATAFELEIDDETGTVKARVDPKSLRVESAMPGGGEAPSLLSASQRAEIERNIQLAVLHGERFPEIAFEGRFEGAALEGELLLHGVRRPVRLQLRSEDETQIAEVELEQRDFGITPFKALLGALRVQSRVRVVARVPRSG